MTIDTEIAPSGSIPSNPEFAEPAPVDQSGQLPEGETDDTKFIDPEAEGDLSASGSEPAAAAPASKTPEELASMVQQSQEFIGKQSTEIGALRKQLEEMQSMMQQGNPQGQPPAEPEPEEALRGVLGKFTSGEATIEDVVMQAFRAGAQQAERTVESKFSQRDQQAQTQALHKSYLEKNPDFAEKYQSGAIQQMLQENPLHNEVSAFESMKRGEAEAQMAELQKQLDAMKAEREASISAGRKAPGKVINTPGSSARVASGGAANPNDVRASMLEAVRAARTAG